jgi:hypothetical protein
MDEQGSLIKQILLHIDLVKGIIKMGKNKKLNRIRDGIVALFAFICTSFLATASYWTNLNKALRLFLIVLIGMTIYLLVGWIVKFIASKLSKNNDK